MHHAFDCHTHAVPARYLRALAADGRFGVSIELREGEPVAFSIEREGGYFRSESIRLQPAHRLLSERLRYMDDVGVERQLLSPPTYVFGYDLDRSAAVDNAAAYNDELSRWIEHEDRFVGLGTVPFQYPDDATCELTRLMGLPKMAGVIIGTRAGDLELDDPALEPFYAAAAELGAIVLVHPNGVSEPERYAPHYLTHSLGLPGETALGLARLVLGGSLVRHPELRIVAAHGGGSFVFLLPRLTHIAREIGQSGTVLSTSELEDSLRRLYFDSVVHGDALGFLVSFAGPERVLLGSDFPAPTGIARPLDAIAGLPDIAPTAFASICSGNLEWLMA